MSGIHLAPDGISSERAINAENVSISLRHHDISAILDMLRYVTHVTSPEMYMMTPSNGNIFRVTGPLWGEFTGDRWIPLTKASDTELWCFLWSAPEQTVEQTIAAWDAIALIMTSL